jgi:DNA-binding MarR family transcriptional regulator
LLYDESVNSRGPLPFDPLDAARSQWIEHGWSELAAAGLVTVTSVMRVQQIFVAAADEILLPYQLTFARWEVLAILAFSNTGTLSAGKVSDRLQIHPATVTSAVKRLEAQKLVRRRADPSDGRGILVQITPRGLAVVERTAADLNAMLFETLPLTRSERDDLFTLMRTIRVQAGDFPAELPASLKPAPRRSMGGKRSSA